MFKVNNKNTKQCHWLRSDVFIVNFKHLSPFFLVFLYLILNKQMLAGLFQNYMLKKIQNIWRNTLTSLYMLSESQLIILMAGLPDKVSLPVQNTLRTPLLLVLYHNDSARLDHGDWSNECVPVSSRNPKRHARIITLSTKHSQDPCKHLKRRALQQQLTVFSR